MSAETFYTFLMVILASIAIYILIYTYEIPFDIPVVAKSKELESQIESHPNMSGCQWLYYSYRLIDFFASQPYSHSCRQSAFAADKMAYIKYKLTNEPYQPRLVSVATSLKEQALEEFKHTHPDKATLDSFRVLLSDLLWEIYDLDHASIEKSGLQSNMEITRPMDPRPLSSPQGDGWFEDNNMLTEADRDIKEASNPFFLAALEERH